MAKILVVDDERHIVETLKSRLENAGYEITAAYDGREGYESAISEKPDLIILDLLLPGMDGFRVCEKLKSDERFKAIPIIMFTARGKGLDLERIMAKELGADAYITKPLEPQVLLSKVEELLAKSKEQGAR